MTNYEQFFQDQMKNPQFAKAYYEARVERVVNGMFEILKDKVKNDESKDNLIQIINSFQDQIHPMVS